MHAQDQIKRKARRERLRELKVRIAAKPASAAHEAEVTRMPLLSKLEAVARRELAYLRAVGDLPRDYPSCATWWMKRLSELRWNGNPCRGKKRLTPVF